MNRRITRYKKESQAKNIFYTHLENNIKAYFIVSVLFIIGVIIGIIFINNLQDTQKSEISEYLNSFITALKNNQEINDGVLLKESILKNLKLTLFLWFMGMSVIGILGVYLAICFRGFILGYTISSAIAFLGLNRGLIFIFTSLFLQTLLFVPSILALAVSGIKLYNSIMKDRRKENIKLEILRHTMFSIAILVVLIICSFIEVNISKNFLTLCIKYL